jgi:hypothetical protein
MTVILTKKQRRNYWVSKFCPLFSILKKVENEFWKLDPFPFSGEGEAPTVLGLLKTTNLN